MPFGFPDNVKGFELSGNVKKFVQTGRSSNKVVEPSATILYIWQT